MTWPRRNPRKCDHKTVADFTVGRDEEGRLMWVCSNCGRQSTWNDGWSYFGNVECTNCWRTAIEFAACSPVCEDELRKKRSKLCLALGVEEREHV